MLDEPKFLLHRWGELLPFYSSGQSVALGELQVSNLWHLQVLMTITIQLVKLGVSSTPNKSKMEALKITQFFSRQIIGSPSTSGPPIGFLKKPWIFQARWLWWFARARLSLDPSVACWGSEHSIWQTLSCLKREKWMPWVRLAPPSKGGSSLSKDRHCFAGGCC